MVIKDEWKDDDEVKGKKGVKSEIKISEGKRERNQKERTATGRNKKNLFS